MNIPRQNLLRREALSAIGLLALSAKAAWSEPLPLKKGGMALQLYTMREPAKKDLAGTLKKCRAMGWEYVQWSGMPTLPAEKIRAALDTADLKAIAAHVSIEAFEKNFDEEVRFWKTVGVKDVAPGGMMKDCKANLAVWLKGVQRLETLGAKLRGRHAAVVSQSHLGVRKISRRPPRASWKSSWNRRGRKTSARSSTLLGLAGGADPAAFIRKYKGRFPAVHAKDVIPGSEHGKHKLTALGKGSVNWKDVFAAGQESGIDWYIYEQDNGQGSPFDYAAESYEFLKKNLPQ